MNGTSQHRVTNDLDQPDLPFTADADDQAQLRRVLRSHPFEWQTRKQLCTSLAWTERRLRDVLETLGTEVVRCQAGFKLTDLLDRSEATIAIQGSDAAISQGKKQIRYGLALRRRIHHLIG